VADSETSASRESRQRTTLRGRFRKDEVRAPRLASYRASASLGRNDTPGSEGCFGESGRVASATGVRRALPRSGFRQIVWTLWETNHRPAEEFDMKSDPLPISGARRPSPGVRSRGHQVDPLLPKISADEDRGAKVSLDAL
jgi:hypothetical protein